ncbi:hypothetical protein AB1Y20_002078 [Prymnesium parvum]|uniref:procollagen-lysine 5-dioxygenase n=1 Tax=Prymnesium parvum TaxID=97485 RepID=A0AB34J6W6_PRYPA
MDLAQLPPSVQRRILSLLAPPPRSTQEEAPPPTSPAELGARELGMAARLVAHGYTWADRVLPDDRLGEMARHARSMATGMVPAGMGQSVLRWHDPHVRGDHTCWVPLDGAAAGEGEAAAALCRTSAFALLRRTLELTTRAVNRAQAAGSEQALALPRKLMLAHYPPGGRYVRHSDVSPTLPYRRVTAILYLNEGWEPAHGGELLLFPPGCARPVAVAPHAGRLVLFDSHMEHEVLSTAVDRWALTAWLQLAHPGREAASASVVAAPAAPLTSNGPTPSANMTDEHRCATAPAAVLDSALHVPPPVTSASAEPSADGCEASAADSPTIFVSIASYRDPEAPHTLRDLFERAELPARVFVGVCFQCDHHRDADCTDLSSLPPACRRNVRSITMDWREARGPTWARFLIQSQLFDDEDYFLQLDSHTRLTQGWDQSLIQMLTRCGSAKPVLSTYPLPYEGIGGEVTLSTESRLTLLCTQPSEKAFDKDSMLRFRARLLAERVISPTPSTFWAAGFSFSSGRFVREVPYDPYLSFLFFGEEISMVVRMWTRGWDLFSPDAHVVFHRWERCYRATFWEIPQGREIRIRSQERVRQLLTTGRVDEHVVASSAESTRGSCPPHRSFLEAAEDRRVDGWLQRARSASTPPPAGAEIWAVGRVRSLAEYEELAESPMRGLALLLALQAAAEENPFTSDGDATQECYTWAADGQCVSNPGYMTSSCKYSCWEWFRFRKDKYPDAPIDKRFDCYSWANSGECHKNKVFMKKECPESCKDKGYDAPEEPARGPTKKKKKKSKKKVASSRKDEV